MNKFTVPVALLALGATCFSAVALAEDDSVMQQRFREQGKAFDLSKFLQGENDARSRSFTFGSPHAHDFTVKSAGVYRFESKIAPGYSDNYRIEAVLMDAQGQVISRDEGNGNSGGLKLEQPLEPGDYTLQVQANRFGTRGRAGDGYSIAITGLDAQGNAVKGAVNDGDGIQFVGTDREGNTNAFVRGGAVATLGSGTAAGATAGSTTASSTATTGASATSAGTAASAAGTSASSAAGVSTGTAVAGGVAAGTAAGVAVASSGSNAATETAPQAATTDAQAAAPAASAAPEQVQSITTDVKIRARGEFLTFNVAQPSQVAITTSTYPGGDEDTYRLVLEVVDESGQVVAEGAGKAGNGNAEIRTQLAPGRYKIQGYGQKFGSSHSGPNNYELKVVLDQ
uniref:hypothetical protein n=1 Tax=Halomonas sp. TaxID=1486246 RepID=UPI0026109AD4|nr:hypothetical protein [Halomonas sp.]